MLWTACRRLCILSLVTLSSACGDSTDPDNTPTAGRDIGELIRDEVEASLDALTLPTTLAPLGLETGAVPCATVSSAADDDGDGIPNDATYTFTAPPCRFTGIRGATLDITGQLRIQDPSPSFGFGYEATITSLRYDFDAESDDADYSITRNLHRSLGGSVAGLQLATDLQIFRTFAGQSDATVNVLWAASFTPETPLQINRPLPSGSLEISGTLDWTRAAESFTMEITTPTPIHYVSGCDGVQRFDAGELRAAGDFAGNPGYVRLRWSDCGRDPEIVFVAEGE